MAESGQMPFMKQLVDSDRKVRDKALDSLQRYLTSGKEFTDLELMQLWRGLFYCMYHTAPPHGPPQLTESLKSLLLSLPTSLSIPFQAAFWRTHATLYPSLDQHRIDKFLRLMRRVVAGGMEALASQPSNKDQVDTWLDMMSEEGTGPLSLGVEEVDGVRVGDGIRYHVLDIWVDEMDDVVEENLMRKLLRPVERLSVEGKTKTVRSKAKDALADPRLTDWGAEVEDVA